MALALSYKNQQFPNTFITATKISYLCQSLEIGNILRRHDESLCKVLVFFMCHSNAK